MIIGFLLCSPDISGGTNVILEHAGGLKLLGHDIVVITAQKVDPERYGWNPQGDQLTWITFESARRMRFDCLVATWWESPYFLHQFESRHYVYFVQSIESRFFQAEDPENLDLRDHSTGAARCEHSYFFSLPIITEATWIRQYLQEQCNQNAYLVRNGIRKELYTGRSVVQKRPDDGLRVLLEGPADVFHKNVPRTIELCREAGVSEVWLLTSSSLEHFDGVDRVFSRVPFEQTPAIYRSCHLLVKLSYVEGMFGPPLEMFHCGGTAIVYNVTGHDEYVEHDVNGLVVEKDDEEQVVEYLRTLAGDPGLLERLCRGAKETAQQWQTWRDSTREFDEALKAITAETPVSKRYLENISELFNSYQTLQLESRELARSAERETQPSSGEYHNFIQAYALSGDEIRDQAWCHYTSGCQVAKSCDLTMPDGDCTLRLDPSVRIGVICLYAITIKNRQGDEIVSYTPGNFECLFLTGTARWLKKHDDFWAIHSYGNDPQMFLPSLQVSGESLSIVITLRELGVGEYINEIDGRVQRSSASRKLISSLRRFLGR
jgi:glycosyltransferase involved in cell wall biosynthesis